MNLIIADNIERIDLTIQSMTRTSDNKDIPIPGTSKISLIYDKTVISRNDVEKLIKSDQFRHNSKILILPCSEADKFKTVFNTIKRENI